MSVKAFRAWLQTDHTVNDKAITAWAEDLGIEHSEVLERWPQLCRNYVLAHFPKAQDFHILYTNRAYHLNQTVAKYMDVSATCTLCNQEPETYVHLFWDCPQVIVIWKKVFEFYNHYTDEDVKLNKNGVLLSCCEKPLLSLFTILTKRRIYLAKVNETTIKFQDMLKTIKYDRDIHWLRSKGTQSAEKFYYDFWSVFAYDIPFDEHWEP